MPELDILHGLEFQIKRVVSDWEERFPIPFDARPIIFPRCFAVGTLNKPYTTCTVDHRPPFADPTALGLAPGIHSVNDADVRRAEGQPFHSLLGSVPGGRLFVRARGKELVVAAGQYAFRFHFGLEGIVAIVDTPSFWELVSKDCPGKNKDGEKSEIMRSFIVPPALTTPAARQLKQEQTINIFAAFVGPKDTFIFTDHSRLLRMHVMVLTRSFLERDLEPESELWPFLWSTNHGPDWIFERGAAEQALDAWRDSVIGSKASLRDCMDSFLRRQNTEDNIMRLKATATRRSKAPHVVACAHRPIPMTKTIIHVLTERQDIFNGYGQHTASDILYDLRIWPGMPAEHVCKDNKLFQSLKIRLHTYAAQFVSDRYRELCLSVPNGPAFAFNYKSDTNYINQYLSVYRKCFVRIRREQYNAMAREGLFNSEHMIGARYHCEDDELIDVNYRDVPVFVYRLVEEDKGDKKKKEVLWYSPIRAKRPSHWRSLPGPFLATDNVLHAGMKTTIGPASFYLFKLNQYDPEAHGKPGRRKKITNGRRGRPAHEPRIGDLRRRDARKRKELAATSVLITSQAKSQMKRRKIASRSAPVPPSDRVTRSRACRTGGTSI
ncbi:hypothetical protein GSI_00585 [Ganoderma sinense ZZ0214-1]|uniref:Uncharacterized protein n=1 Tax=Ganoderma sinense ZZ0214-1 TaxID=1077348 RepID=A0A2G8SSZ7_9APHY|nr:hypothetical protein GSI_00585 [Ganoderma sinense ZZ0214-1]